MIKKLILRLFGGRRYMIKGLIKEMKKNMVKLEQNILVLETMSLINPRVVHIKVRLYELKCARDSICRLYNNMRKQYWITYGEKIF